MPEQSPAPVVPDNSSNMDLENPSNANNMTGPERDDARVPISDDVRDIVTPETEER